MNYPQTHNPLYDPKGWLLLLIGLIGTLLVIIGLSGCPSRSNAAPSPPPKSYKNHITQSGIRPGFKFRYWNYQMEIWKVEGDLIYYQSSKHKNRNFQGNPMPISELLKVLRECPQTLYNPVE